MAMEEDAAPAHDASPSNRGGALWHGPWPFVGLALVVRLIWIAVVPTIPVGDFAMYRESANYLVERGHLDPGFIYMPGFVAALALLRLAGGELWAAKVFGAVCGGLAVWPLHALTARLFDDRGPTSRRPVAAVAGILYAFWPGGVSFASVIATDIPAAGLVTAGLATLVWAADRDGRPGWLGHLGAGAWLGLASYVRAVALPMLAVSALYLVARGFRRGLLAKRLGLTVVGASLLLFPWGVRNARHEGGFALTDSHGGITALMGINPNADGTYARSLHEMWKEVTGRTFLSPPHRQTDRLAWDVARRWWRASPAWTLGMIPLRAERLFAAEHGLLYWSLYRPGVVPARFVARAATWRPALTAITDAFWIGLVVAFAFGCAGGGSPADRRRSTAGAVLLVAAAATSAATYALLVAEPRYRLGLEALMIPLAARGLVMLARVGRASFGGGPRASLGSASFGADRGRGLWAQLAPPLALLAGGALLLVAVPALGDRLLARGRWAISTAHVDGRACFLYVTPLEGPGGASSVRGQADQVTLRGAPDAAGSSLWRLDCLTEAMPSSATGRWTLSLALRREHDPGERAGLEATAFAEGLHLPDGRSAQLTPAASNDAVTATFPLDEQAMRRGWTLVFAPPQTASARVTRVELRPAPQAPRAASSDGTR